VRRAAGSGEIKMVISEALGQHLIDCGMARLQGSTLVLADD
jgi:hypothetical protein